MTVAFILVKRFTLPGTHADRVLERDKRIRPFLWSVFFFVLIHIGAADGRKLLGQAFQHFSLQVVFGYLS